MRLPSREPSPSLVEDMAGLDGDIAVLGAGGKMGPSLCSLAVDALGARGGRQVFAVSRWSDPEAVRKVRETGAQAVRCDLADRAGLAALPDVPNVIFMAGRKFGTTNRGAETWWSNVVVPALAAERYAGGRVAVFSTGNVYPLMPAHSGGADPTTPPEPVGEYAWSALGRERVFERASTRYGSAVALLRLSYATDLRYGVLTDIARSLLAGRPVDISAGRVNICWQDWANEVALRSLLRAANPPAVFNVTGPETPSVRWLTEELAHRLGVVASTVGDGDPDRCLISDASATHVEFGHPPVSLEQLLDLTASYMAAGEPTIDAPTHFEARDGRF